MEELKTEWHTEGFVKDAKYSFHIVDVIKPYKDKFPGAQKLIVNIRELTLFELQYPSKTPGVNISSDRTVITINQTVHKYYDPKGKVTGVPDPFSVFTSLRFLLDKAVEEYAKKDDNQ